MTSTGKREMLKRLFKKVYNHVELLIDADVRIANFDRVVNFCEEMNKK
jgi:hypothetical protein